MYLDNKNRYKSKIFDKLKKSSLINNYSKIYPYVKPYWIIRSEPSWFASKQHYPTKKSSMKGGLFVGWPTLVIHGLKQPRFLKNRSCVSLSDIDVS